MLIDTESTIDSISKTYQNKERFKILKQRFKFQTATGEQNGNEFDVQTFEGKDIKFFLHDFHSQFHILLSLPTILEMNVIIDFENNSIKIKGKKYKMQYFQDLINTKGN